MNRFSIRDIRSAINSLDRAVPEYIPPGGARALQGNRYMQIITQTGTILISQQREDRDLYVYSNNTTIEIDVLRIEPLINRINNLQGITAINIIDKYPGRHQIIRRSLFLPEQKYAHYMRIIGERPRYDGGEPTDDSVPITGLYNMPPDIVDKIVRFASEVPQMGGFGLVSLNNDVRYLRSL